MNKRNKIGLMAICVLGVSSIDVMSAKHDQIPMPSQFEEKQTPWQLIRHLQHAQDAIALGNGGSLELYRKLLILTSGLMLKQPAEIWFSPKNLNAAAVYVMIGGNPAVGRQALDAIGEDLQSSLPLIAAMAYAERNFSLAHKAMLGIDHTKLPAGAAAQFALVKSMVTSSTNLEKASHFLDEARRLAPGTLIEEASLRRSLRIVGERREFERFKTNARIYFRRFNRSHYFGDFLKNYAYGLARMPVEKQDQVLAYLKDFMAKLNTGQQLNVLIYVARNATVSGRVEIAHWASNQALVGLKNNPQLGLRMTLYSAAAGMVQPELHEASLRQFSEIERGKLTENDRKLFDAVSSLAQRLQSEPVNVEKMKSALRRKQQIFPEDEPELPQSLESETQIINQNTVLSRAQILLAQLEGEVE